MFLFNYWKIFVQTFWYMKYLSNVYFILSMTCCLVLSSYVYECKFILYSVFNFYGNDWRAFSSINKYRILLYLRFSIKSFQIYFLSRNRYQGQKYHANLPLVYQWKYFFKRKSLQKKISSNHRTTSLEKWNVWKKCKTSIIFCTIMSAFGKVPNRKKNEIRLICELSAGYRLGYRKIESIHSFELWFVPFEWNLAKKY